MGLEMRREDSKTIKHWVHVFRKIGIYEREDLEQEAQCIWLSCQESFDNSKSKFSTWFSTAVKNRFLDLLRMEIRRGETIQLSLDPILTDPETGEDEEVEDFGCPDGRWTPDEQLEWDALLESTRERLSGLPLKVFNLRIEPDLRFYKVCKRQELPMLTDTDMGRRLGRTRAEIEKANYSVKRAALLALGLDIQEIVELIGSPEI